MKVVKAQVALLAPSKTLERPSLRHRDESDIYNNVPLLLLLGIKVVMGGLSTAPKPSWTAKLNNRLTAATRFKLVLPWLQHTGQMGHLWTIVHTNRSSHVSFLLVLWFIPREAVVQAGLFN